MADSAITRRQCASQRQCQIGIIENGATGTSSTFHRCRQCRELLCSILCSALQEEEEFLCWPCHNSQQQPQKAVSNDDDDDKENENPQQRQQRTSKATTATTPAPPSRQGVRHHLETPTFHTGDFVDIAANGKSFGGKAWVTAVSHTPGGHAVYDAKYVIPTMSRFTPNVSLARLDAATLEPSGRVRRQQEGVSAIQPSLLSRNYVPTTVPIVNEKNKPQPTNKKPAIVNRLLSEAHDWSKKKEGIHPIEKFIKRNRNLHKGYLRERQANDEKQKVERKSLSENEWGLVMKMRDSLEGRRVDQKDKTYSPFGDFATAWGITQQALNRKRKRIIDDPTLSLKRKKRFDAGSNLFNSDKKREQVYTPYLVYKKERMRASTLQDPLEASEIRSDWEREISSNKDFLRRYEIKATLELKRAVHLENETKALLLKTKGTITWRRLESQLQGGRGNTKPVSRDTIRRHVMSLPDSCYTTTRLHPKLDDQHRARRFDWTKGFWLFWQTATLLATACQVILFHMDEKWFYDLVIRRNNKCIPFYGVFPVNHARHHKSHPNKTMFIATEGYEPLDNDMEKGGISHKLSFTRVGKMGTAKKDSYKRVYRTDGTYHYPQLPENLLRKKGDPKWENLEINGSKEGTAKAPKFSLKKWFLEVELPRLDKLAAWRQSVLNKRIIIRYQWDGAGPHQDEELLRTIYYEFAKRGWLFTFQPSQSPLTNVNDACIFPALSKKVSEEQGQINGSMILSEDRLAEVAKDVFWNFPNDTIARAFAGTHQIVNAIYAEEGGDNFAQEKGGLHCGIRRAFVPKYATEEPGEKDHPIGVEVFESPEAVDASGLKYKTPTVLRDENIMERCGEYLTGPELELLVQELEKKIEQEEKEDGDDVELDLLRSLWIRFGDGLASQKEGASDI